MYCGNVDEDETLDSRQRVNHQLRDIKDAVRRNKPFEIDGIRYMASRVVNIKSANS